MSIFSSLRHLVTTGVLACLVPATQGGVTVTQNLGAGATSWPDSPLVSTTSSPSTQATIAEGFGGTTSYGQTFTVPSGSNYTLQTIYLYAGGGTGSSGSAPVTVNLFDLGAMAAPNPSPYSANLNLLGGGAGVSIAYATQTAGLLRLDFTGDDQVTLGAGHMYVFEISGTSGTNPITWFRTAADTYAGGAGYRGRTWINGNNAREFSMAVYGVATTNQPAPTTCVVDAAAVKQRIDGFGAGVAFLNNGITRLTEPQVDLLYGTAGTQAGLTLLRVRISPTGDNADALADGQKAHARGARILATPWSPPAAMKDNGSLIHGSLLPANYGAYVTHLNDFASFMAANGAPISVISIQNEPDWDPDYEGCAWSAEQFRVFCRDFAGSINVPVMMPESLGFVQTVSNATLNDPAAVANVDYIGGHLYGATVKDYPLARSLNLPMWMTEYLENDQVQRDSSGNVIRDSNGQVIRLTDAEMIAGAVTTGRQIIDCLTVGYMSGYIWWKCIGDSNGLLNESGVPQRRAYVMGQFSRFARPGDYRVDVPSNTGPMGITAFKDAPSGRFAIVAANNTTLPVNQTFTLQGVVLTTVTPYITSATQSLEALAPVAVSNSAFTYSVPANSVVTFSGVSAAAPAITTQPGSQTVNAGGSVLFTAAASGDPAPTYQWKKDGVAIGGATGISYSISNAVASDAGSYTVVATNIAGSATSNAAVLTVQTSPSFTTQPLSQAVPVGSAVTFTASAGGVPAPTFQWRKDGVAITGATGSSLTLGQTLVGDAAAYSVVATNVVGSATSADATLTLVVPVVSDPAPAGFDASGYLARYPANAALFGTNYAAAWEYYRTVGIYQGETYDELFRVEEYLALYPELFTLFGDNLGAALMHWVTIGSIEGKLGRIPTEFSAAGYFARNPDVALAVGNDPVLAWGHYWLYGIYEGFRAYDDELRVFEYLAINADLTAAFVNDWRQAALHWMRYGRTEGRLGRIPLTFNVTEYLNRNPDVAASWGTNPTTVFLHYWTYGIDEGRTYDDLFRPDQYLALNPDLAAIFGTDRRGAFKHWVRYGMAEGRPGKNP